MTIMLVLMFLWMLFLLKGTNLFEIKKSNISNPYDVYKLFFNMGSSIILGTLINICVHLYIWETNTKKYNDNKKVLTNNRINDEEYNNNLQTQEVIKYFCI